MVPIYLDHARNSFPKPERVKKAILDSLSTHVDSGVLDKAEKTAAQLFQTQHSIIFTANEGIAFSIILQELIQPEDHLLVNPLCSSQIIAIIEKTALKQSLSLDYLDIHPKKGLNPQINHMIKPNTKLIITPHGCQITGMLFPIDQMREWGIPLVIDISSSAGLLPLRLDEDLAIFSGHLGLFGPMGTAGLYIPPQLHNDSWPTTKELGTPNIPGLAGLTAGMELLLQKGLENIQEIWQGYLTEILEFIKQHPSISVFGPADPQKQLPCFAFNIQDLPACEVNFIFDQVYDFILAGGLISHPLALTTLKCPPTGLLRASFNHETTPKEISSFTRSLKEISSP